MRNLHLIIALALLASVIMMPARPAVTAMTVKLSGNMYDYYWGHPPTLPPNMRLVGKQEVSKDDALPPGTYWEVMYRIKVHVHICFGDNPAKKVREILTQYLQRVLGKIKFEHPNIFLFYAEFKEVGTEDDPQDPFGWWEIYDVHVIGRVMSLTTSTPQCRKLVGWVGVAVILALLLGCIIATKMVIDDPNSVKVLKWIVEPVKEAISAASSAASKIIAETGPVMWVAVAGIGLFLIALAITLILADMRRSGFVG